MERDIDNLIENTLSAWDNGPKAAVPSGFAGKVVQRVRDERKTQQRRTYIMAAASLLLVGLNIAVVLNVMRAFNNNMTVQAQQDTDLLQQMQQEYFHNDGLGSNL